VNASVLRRLRAFFPEAKFRNFYGSTEAPLIAAYTVPEGAEILDVIPLGTPVTNVEVALRTDDGEIVDATLGAEGEALVRSDILMMGYCGSPEETADAFIEQRSEACLCPVRRWYRTRDRVSVDEGGQLRYVCRVDQMLKVGGMRLDPSEVEAAMIEQPGITSCAVVGISTEERGTRLIGFFTGTGDGEKIRRALLQRLPRYMVPDECYLEAELPQTTSGKVDRKVLQQLASQRVGVRP
jgi:acyl-CoA synthetase (AMP-forming)/AMP-acid ligase II